MRYRILARAAVPLVGSAIADDRALAPRQVAGVVTITVDEAKRPVRCRHRVRR